MSNSFLHIFKFRIKAYREHVHLSKAKHINILHIDHSSANVFKCENDIKENFMVSAIARNANSIIAARDGGRVVEIIDGVEKEILFIEGSTDWRGLWKDSNGNIFVSPHSSPSLGQIRVEDRGIYKLAANANKFAKVHSLYDPSSQEMSETKVNDDTIWTFCEDASGALYAGVYAHTMRSNPSIYKSVDSGEHWKKIYNFNESGLLKNGRHIHGIIYSKADNALYALVGEINDLFKSTDGGYSWASLNVKTELAKGCALEAVDDGIIIGSDSAYDCVISKYYFKTNKIVTKTRIFGGTIFSIRTSDITNNLYAFSKVDGSVKELKYFPPIESLEDISIIKK